MRPGSSWFRLWPACLLVMLQGGCGRPSDVPAASSGGQPLRIAAASDLQHVLPVLARRFHEVSGTTSSLILDSSGRLTEQIKAGAPFDVFMSANVKFVRGLVEAGLVDSDSVKNYTRGVLVICAYRPANIQVRNLADLLQPEVKKVAIANPEYAPYGAAAKQALERAGLWAKIEPKIVRAATVREAFAYVQSGDAEAALVSRSQAAGADVLTVDLDPSLYDPLIQAMGVVSASSQRDQAGRFVEFVMGSDGQRILREAGFEKPAPAAAASKADETSPPPRGGALN